MVEAMTSSDAEGRRAAVATVVAVYWRPVYFHLRTRWSRQPADAEDLTQEFFAAALAGDFFADYDPARARFRTFLRLCCDRFAARAVRDAQRLKRGGGVAHLSLDFPAAELALAQTITADPEAAFDAETVRGLLALAVADLREHCRAEGCEIRFAAFERYDLAPDGRSRPTYREIAEALGLPGTQVTNHLAWARRMLRRRTLQRLRELCSSEAEFQDEARALFGVTAG